MAAPEFTDLPNDILAQILVGLDKDTEIAQVSRTSRQLHLLAEDEYLWRSRIIKTARPGELDLLKFAIKEYPGLDEKFLWIHIHNQIPK